MLVWWDGRIIQSTSFNLQARLDVPKELKDPLDEATGWIIFNLVAPNLPAKIYVVIIMVELTTVKKG